jgi:hypothetical protein
MLVSQIEKYENACWLFSRVNRYLKLLVPMDPYPKQKTMEKHYLELWALDPYLKKQKNEPKYFIFP